MGRSADTDGGLEQELGHASTLPASELEGGALPAPRVDDVVDPAEQARVFEALFQTPGPIHRIGRYVVLGKLGSGGMGTVLEAFDRALDRRVAVKVLHRGLGERQQQRLEREAKALAKLSHPNVVQIYEVSEFEGQAFIAMELVEGRSLREWMAQEPRPRWHACLEVYLQAGKGLAAAHAQGLIHRDFKPDNALVGDDGRVRVADFGLARPSRRDDSNEAGQTTRAPTLDDDPSGSGTNAMVTLTKTGSIVGTIAYMAPEQMQGLAVDARADQFSFCVALYEAVYGQRPWDAGTLVARMLALQGARPEPKRLESAPRWLHRVLLRGLAIDPEQRFPSMDALLAALARPSKRRRWLAAGLMAGSTALAVTGALAWRPPPCEVDPTQLEGAWDDEQRQRVRTALTNVGVGPGQETIALVERTLDEWSTGWLDARQRACEATRVAGVQSEAGMDRRMQCLERERRELDELVALLARGEPAVVMGVGTALSELPDLGACDDPRTAEERFPLPEEPMRSEILDAMAVLAQARVMVVVGGMDDEVDAIAAELQPLVQRVDHPPLTLELSALRATRLIKQHRYDDGATAMLSVIRDAEVFGLHELVATLRVNLVGWLAGVWYEPKLEDLLLADAETALRRLGRRDDPRMAELLEARSKSASARGDHRAALADLERALPLARELDAEWLRLDVAAARMQLGDYDRAEADLHTASEAALRRWGPRSAAVGRAEHEWAMLELGKEHFDRARAHLDEALAITVPLYGADSLQVAALRHIAAKLSMFEGDIEESLRTMEQVLEVYERLLGPYHPRLGGAYNAIGVLRYHADDLPGSVDSYQRAIEISERTLGERHPEVALLHSNLGESLLALDRHAPALAEFERALRILERAVPQDHPMLTLPLKGRAQVLLALGDPATARIDLERALAIAEANEGEPFERADIQASLARALHELGGDEDRALVLATRAADELRGLGFEERARAVEAWAGHAADVRSTPAP